jgi:hypothetical protein
MIIASEQENTGMARKLTTYQTALGIFEQAMAAPSMRRP